MEGKRVKIPRGPAAVSGDRARGCHCLKTSDVKPPNVTQRLAVHVDSDGKARAVGVDPISQKTCPGKELVEKALDPNRTRVIP